MLVVALFQLVLIGFVLWIICNFVRYMFAGTSGEERGGFFKLSDGWLKKKKRR